MYSREPRVGSKALVKRSLVLASRQVMEQKPSLTREAGVTVNPQASHLHPRQCGRGGLGRGRAPPPRAGSLTETQAARRGGWTGPRSPVGYTIPTHPFTIAGIHFLGEGKKCDHGCPPIPVGKGLLARPEGNSFPTSSASPFPPKDLGPAPQAPA